MNPRILSLCIISICWSIVKGHQDDGLSFECDTNRPKGSTRDPESMATLPPIAFTVGDLRMNQVSYSPGAPLKIGIAFDSTKVHSIFVKAQSIVSTDGIGSFVVLSGNAFTKNCGNSDNSLTITSDGNTGIIIAAWIAPAGLAGYVEFQLTAVDSAGRYWFHHSILCNSV